LINLSELNSTQITNFCGPLNCNLKVIETELKARLSFDNNSLSIVADVAQLAKIQSVIEQILEASLEESLSPDEIRNLLRVSERNDLDELELHTIKLKKKYIRPKSKQQCRYIQGISNKVINFGIGPAGTGKTFLAVAKAVEALEQEEVSRLILTRPAVEAGEKLGFLPGDLSQKVDPYLRPVYDALYEMFGFEKVEKLISRHVIEVAPLAYMRGRTLNNAFVILDEAQNTTPAQMKMFLTRIGFGSKAVVTGDITQTDLPDNRESGLKHCLRILKDVDAIGMTWFNSGDVVRHPLVQTIVEAYENSSDND
jgi:phosphate starvation-inducible PhoH-like protein